MKNQLALLFLMAVLFGACQEKNRVNPDPAAFLAGEYVSDKYGIYQDNQVSYPINGQDVTMKITRVTGDTVRVDIQSAPNGDYSPGKNLTYPKAFIKSTTGDNNFTSYNIFLYPRTGGELTDAIQFYKSDNSLSDYWYVPAGGNPNITRKIRFKRK